MKNIKKNLQNTFKNFFYLIFKILHGKIKGKVLFKEESRIVCSVIQKEEKFKYKVFRIKEGRLYTDRIHDMAIILDNNVVEGPSYQLRPVNNANIQENIVFKKGTPRRIKKLKGKVLSLLTGGAGNDNYFHWMFDVLPRIGIINEGLNISEIDYFLLPSIDKKFQKETLDLLKIPEKKRLSSKNFRHISAPEIIVADHPYCFKNDASNEIQNIPFWISKWLKNNFLHKNNESESKGKKIYIDRSDSSSNVKNLRSILNEEDVKDFLKKEGFEFVTLGDLNFTQQVRVINDAEMIIGLHGAGFANLCFCKPKTKIVELRSRSAGKMYENLAKSNSLIYESINCKPEKFDKQNQFGHIKIKIDELKNTIKKIN